MDARELSEDRARRIAQSSTGLPLLQCLPQRIGQKADQDVGLDACLLVVPDRADTQVGLLDAEGRFGFGELDVSLPKLGVTPVVDVAA